MSTNSKVVVVVDNSNIFIEGQKYSAKNKGVVISHLPGRDPQDPSWRIDFGALLREVASGRAVAAAILVGSRPPQNDSVWDMAKNAGFTVTVHDRGSTGGEKAVDTELVAQGTEIICTAGEPMDLAILSGDRDFLPLVTMAQKHGWSVEMWAFKNSFNSVGQMATSVNIIKPMDDIFNQVGAHAFQWP
ncbi:MAG: NYN domain-containing protein [Prosthecobacter sp.]|nr:NYN domain-containing protein [Prosthecobacter sp.]